MENIDIIKTLYTAFSEGDEATIRTLFADDIEWRQNPGFPGGGTHVGADAIFENVFRKFKKDWASWGAPVTEYLDAGSTIIVLGEYQGTHAHTQKSMRAEFAHVYRLNAGKITHFQQYTDTHQVVEAAV